MSDVPGDYRTQLVLRAEIARIDRDRAESEKLRRESEMFIAEQRELLAEDMKLSAEQKKLTSEARKLDRDHWLAPWSLVIALATGFGLGLAKLLVHLAGWWR